MAGRSVLNFHGIAYGGHEFINVLKNGHSRQAYSSPGYVYPAEINTDGYPSGSTLSGNIAHYYFLPLNYSGDWIIEWDGQIATSGNSGIRIVGAVTVVSGGSFVNGATSSNLHLTGTDGSVRFSFVTPPDIMTLIFLSTGSFSGFENMRMYRATHATNVANGEIFNPDFLDALLDLNPKVLRFLDWEDVNGINLALHADRVPLSAFTWSSAQWGRWVGTIGGTDTYTCNSGRTGSYVHGEIIQGQITNANTSATPTLNDNSRGAKTVTTMWGSTQPVGTLTAAGWFTFIYDSVLDVFLSKSGGISGVAGSDCNVPLSVQIALCNELGMDGWFHIPHLYDDASITAFVTEIRDGLDSGLTAYLQYSNEIWNTFFSGAGLVGRRGEVAMSLTTSSNRHIHGAYGRRVCEMMDLARAAWSPRSNSELRGVLDVQNVGDSTTNGIWNVYRMKGADLGPWGFDVEGNRPIDKVDVICNAPYVYGPQVGGVYFTDDAEIQDFLDAADDYASGTPALMEAALDWVDGNIRDGVLADDQSAGEHTVAAMETYLAGWNARAVEHEKTVIWYEMGVVLLAPTSDECTSMGISTTYATKCNTLIQAYKNTWRYQALIQAFISNFHAYSNTERACFYDFLRYGGESATRPHPYAMFPGDLYSTPFKSYDAIKAYNNRKRRFVLTGTS